MDEDYREFLETAERRLLLGKDVKILFTNLSGEFRPRQTKIHLLGPPDAPSAYAPANFGLRDKMADAALLSEPKPLMLGGNLAEFRKLNMPELPVAQAHAWLLNAFGIENAVVHRQTPEQIHAVGAEDETETVPRGLTDLTALAREGKLTTIIGLEKAIEQLMLFLSRMIKCNVLLVGEPGVGKTALVEKLAQCIVSGDVPEGFPVRTILRLDLVGLFAGAGTMGEPEARFKQIMEFVCGDGKVLFIDEIHMIDDPKGSFSIADSLKPIMASGEVRVIGATTTLEARRIEEDAALHRRFARIYVEEPTPEQTNEILHGILPEFEAHHGVTIEDSAMELIVPLAYRYVPQKRFPDKAIDVLDVSFSLCKLRGDTVVTEGHVLQAVESISGIPVQRFGVGDPKLLELESFLAQRIIGQDSAIETVSNALRVNQSGLSDGGPPGFLFAGPSGVGKTKTALCLAEFWFGNQDAIVRIDMTEYQESHKASLLLGAPPGYVGYERGGMLTEAVKNKPFCILLLDEFGKAHPDVTNIVLQIADYGRLTDSAGTSVNFRESIMVLTANLAPDQLKMHFRPELLGRLRIVPFRALDDHDLCVIANNELDRLREKLVEKDIVLEYSDDVLLHLVADLDSAYGARDLKKSIEVQVVQPMANLMLREDFSTITLAADDGELTLTGNRRREQ